MQDKLARQQHYLWLCTDATVHVADVQATMHEQTQACMMITQFQKKELDV